MSRDKSTDWIATPDNFRSSSSSVDAGGRAYPNDSSVKLYKGDDRTGIWPSELAKYYDALDAERSLPKAKLCNGYGRRGKAWEPI